MTSIYRALASSTTPNAISKGYPNLESPPTPITQLSVCVITMSVCFHLRPHNSSAYTSSLLHFLIQLRVFIGRSPKDKINPHSLRVVDDHTVHPHPTRRDVTVHANAIMPYCDTHSRVHHEQNLRDLSLIISSYQVNSRPTS